MHSSFRPSKDNFCKFVLRGFSFLGETWNLIFVYRYIVPFQRCKVSINSYKQHFYPHYSPFYFAWVVNKKIKMRIGPTVLKFFLIVLEISAVLLFEALRDKNRKKHYAWTLLTSGITCLPWNVWHIQLGLIWK